VRLAPGFHSAPGGTSPGPDLAQRRHFANVRLVNPRFSRDPSGFRISESLLCGNGFARDGGPPRWRQSVGRIRSIFGTVAGRAVVGAFDGGVISSDAGGLLLGVAEAIGLVRLFTARRPD
jgi:hypothetical protein